MYSAGDIAELEKKYSTYMKKKVVKFCLIFFSSLIIVSLLFYSFWEKQSIISFIQSKINNVSHISKSPTTPIKSIVSAKQEHNETNASETLAVATQPKAATSTNTTTAIKMDKEDVNKTLSLPIPVKTTQKKVESNTTSTNNNNTSFHLQSASTRKVDALSSSLVLKLPEIKIKKEKKADKKKVKEEITQVKRSVAVQNTNKIAQTDAPDANHSDGIKIEMKKIDAIKYLKDKFNENHSIIFALMLCKEYYQKKDFIDSLKWSIIANDIDNTNERSWIWFAKSKYRLNHKDDAIKALKAYLNTNNSDSIRSLLHDIINGELYD